VTDRRVRTLIHRFLKAGVRTLEGSVEPTAEGTPHGHRHEAKKVTACMVKTHSNLPVVLRWVA
jgi:hypothetical protein